MIMILTGGARGEHPLFVSLENRESIGRQFFVFEADENLEKWCAPDTVSFIEIMLYLVTKLCYIL
ncbi:MAG: hypothetical protein Q4F47_06530 [Bacteroidaceae bacterium]|nr:hypothetical protein [Bacteroidaceae bacterium]